MVKYFPNGENFGDRLYDGSNLIYVHAFTNETRLTNTVAQTSSNLSLIQSISNPTPNPSPTQPNPQSISNPTPNPSPTQPPIHLQPNPQSNPPNPIPIQRVENIRVYFMKM